jgi:UMF1 family MFS transporter
MVLVAALSFLLSNYFYQFCLIFYNSLLQQLAPPPLLGRISGFGQAANWLGQAASIFITLPLATGAIYIFGHPGRAQTLLPATILFFLLALPMLLLFKETTEPKIVRINFLEEFKNYFKNLAGLVRIPGVARYLLGFFFFNDAILTMENNYAIYMQQVFNASDKAKALLLLGVLLMAAVGAFCSGFVADRIGIKKFLVIILGIWIFLMPALGLSPNFAVFTGLSMLLGLIYGSTWTTTSAVITYLIPPEKINEGFSYYSIAERFATFIGPITWGLVTTLLLQYGLWRYKVATIIMGIFVLIGALIIKKIPSDKAYGTAGQ